MSWKSFAKSFGLDYFTNLFILWEIILVVIGFVSIQIPAVNNFRTILWANFGFLVIFCPLLMLQMYYDVWVIKNNSEFSAIIRENMKKRIEIGMTLGMHLVSESYLFLTGIMEIIGDQLPQIIKNTDVPTYHYWQFFGYIAIYSIIPILRYLSIYFTNKSLKVRTELNYNRFKIDLSPFAFYVCMAFIVPLIATVVINYQIRFLK